MNAFVWMDRTIVVVTRGGPYCSTSIVQGLLVALSQPIIISHGPLQCGHVVPYRGTHDQLFCIICGGIANNKKRFIFVYVVD
jgi:hypothetical protein